MKKIIRLTESDLARIVKRVINESTGSDWDRPTILAVQGKLAVTKTGVTDQATIQALKGYQEGHALPVTGRIDSATLKTMGIKGNWVPGSYTAAERKAGANGAIR